MLQEVLAEGKGPRDFISLEGAPEIEYEPSEAPSGIQEVEIPPSSQPESEIAPPSSPTECSAPAEKDMEIDGESIDGVDVPVPSDDELFVFGDAYHWKETTAACFEITFKNGLWADFTPEESHLCCVQYDSFLTASPKKERIEVRWSDLSEKDKLKFCGKGQRT